MIINPQLINQNDFFLELKINWNDSKAKLKTKFSTLTDNDLWYVEGKKYLMLNRIQVKLGKTNEEMQVIINEL